MSTQVERIPASAAKDLDSLLGPGEKVLWRGKPARREFVFRTWPLSVFGAVLFVTFLGFQYVVLTSDEAPDWLALYAIPFGLLGLYMLAGHFLVTSLEWSRMEYMVTDTRVLIRHGIFSPSVTIYSLLGLPHTEVQMRGQGVGNIVFKPRQGEGYGPWPGYQNMWPYTPGYLVGMLCIRDPEGVRGIVERARRGT